MSGIVERSDSSCLTRGYQTAKNFVSSSISPIINHPFTSQGVMCVITALGSNAAALYSEECRINTVAAGGYVCLAINIAYVIKIMQSPTREEDMEFEQDVARRTNQLIARITQ